MCGGRGIAPKTDGIAVDCRLLPFVSDVLKSRGTADSGGENRRREQPEIANREDKSDAQRNRELRNYESNGEHSITSGPRTQAAGGHARSSTVFPCELQALLRSRACGLSDLQLLRSYFTITRLVRPMSMLEVRPPEFESLDQLGFASAEQQLGSDPWEIRSRR